MRYLCDGTPFPKALATLSPLWTRNTKQEKQAADGETQDRSPALDFFLPGAF